MYGKHRGTLISLVTGIQVKNQFGVYTIGFHNIPLGSG
jgi:hypothetical protein